MKRLGLIAAVVVAAYVSANACSVPVFRYALERWAPDIYIARVETNKVVTAEQKAAAELMNCFEEESVYRGNIVLIDDERTNVVHTGDGPILDVSFPRPIDIPLWKGPLTDRNVRMLLDSPARREITKRVLAGDSAVWVLVESGDKAKDDEAAKLLDETLAELQEELALPEISEADRMAVLDGSGGPELKIAFSTMRLKKDDPQEEVFISNLLSVDESLKTTNAPVAYAVFGRGRALPPLVGEMLTDEIIAEVCYYIVGECSCEIKAQNIGFDLLVSADWDEALYGSLYSEHELPPLTTVSPELVTNETESATNETAAVTNAPDEANAAASSAGGERRSPLGSVWVLVAVVAVVVVLGSVFMLRGK